MYWWHIAAEKVRTNQAKRFGLITTNSIRQTFNRAVTDFHLDHKTKPLSIIFAIPDHPWVDSADGADVRIAMTVGVAGEVSGVLRKVISEVAESDSSADVTLDYREGRLYSSLSVGADIARTVALNANFLISNRGMIPHGAGFLVTQEQGANLDGGALMRPYRNGRDITSRPRGVYVLDTFNLEEPELRSRYPETWQWLLNKVKPDRDQKKDRAIKERWWLFARSRPDIRDGVMSLSRYIVTVQTSKHRFFTFLSAGILPDDKLIAITLDDACSMGILSSRLHILGALASGGALGVGNDPVYNKSKCFEAFPFPDLKTEQAKMLGMLAERIDIHRTNQQAQHEKLTITGMYNVLDECGVVSALRELHDELDRAVFDAYDWNDLADKLVGRPGATTPLPDKPAEQAEAEEELLIRLVALNTQRAAEEAQGHIRWLRPDYQAPTASQTSGELNLESEQAAAIASPQGKQSWPKSMPEQVAIVRSALSIGPQNLDALVSQFKRKPTKSVEQVLIALQVLGHAERSDDQWRLM